MCDPMSITSLAFTAVSTAVSMAAQQQQAKRAQAAANAQADIAAQTAENERATQAQLAQNEVQKGIDERNQFVRDAARKQGEMTNRLAANGFELDSGTNASLLGENVAEAQHQANLITQNAAQNAWGFTNGMVNAENKNSIAQFQSQQAISDSKNKAAWGMADSLLGAAGQGLGIYKDWAKQQKANAVGVGLNATGAALKAVGTGGGIT